MEHDGGNNEPGHGSTQRGADGQWHRSISQSHTEEWVHVPIYQPVDLLKRLKKIIKPTNRLPPSSPSTNSDQEMQIGGRDER
jgi:hypothetical protein